MGETFRAVDHADLSEPELAALGALFDHEYLTDHGSWDPDCPYGYSPADVHTFAFVDGVLVGHVGFQRRTIDVGDAEVVVAGTGGVLVGASLRGNGLGQRLISRAHKAMRADSRIDFGYLGCCEEVVRFYENVGWRRVQAIERHVSMLDPRKIVVSVEVPILVIPTHGRDWPAGDIDLRGTPWRRRRAPGGRESRNLPLKTRGF